MARASHSGINIAFVGLNQRAQVSCTEYLRTHRGYVRRDMDGALKRFIRTSYGIGYKKKGNIYQKYALYDALYRVDNEIFINYIAKRIQNSTTDTVISDVRYLNELRGLQDLGFHIVRVTTDTRRLRPEQIIKTASEGTVGVALKYDRDFAGHQNVPNTVHWTSKAAVGPLMDTLLEHLGYKFDL